jgi:outer membrane protein assembly factor BamD (BamD/ComL family)
MTQLEERVAHLEAEVAMLKNKVENDLAAKPWWEEIAGTFSDNSAYDEAMQLGREYRNSLRLSSTEPSEET